MRDGPAHARDRNRIEEKQEQRGASDDRTKDSSEYRSSRDVVQDFSTLAGSPGQRAKALFRARGVKIVPAATATAGYLRADSRPERGVRVHGRHVPHGCVTCLTVIDAVCLASARTQLLQGYVRELEM
jgi:hypothetical protein